MQAQNRQCFAHFGHGGNPPGQTFLYRCGRTNGKDCRRPVETTENAIHPEHLHDRPPWNKHDRLQPQHNGQTNLIFAFQKAIDLLDAVCRKALKTVIDFAKEPLTKQFTFEQACAVNDFFIQTPTDNMLPIHCLYCPIPSSRKTSIPKGDWRCRTWSTTFQNTKGLRKKRWDIRPSRGLKI